MATVDRKKYVVDVLEHVLGGVHATTDATPEAAHTDVVRLGVRPWLGLGTMDSVRVERPAVEAVSGKAADEGPRPSRRQSRERPGRER